MRSQTRRSERTYPRSERIAWRETTDPGALRPASVSNVSRSGVAIRIVGDPNISHGTAIQTLTRRSPTPRRARVVRIEQTREHGKLETTIGCRWISSEEHVHHSHSLRHFPSQPECRGNQNKKENSR